MAHKLITGCTLSGKSTLAKLMVSDAKKRGIASVIYDPTLSEWDSEHITDGEHEFFYMLNDAHKKGFPVFVVIDEADTILSMSHRHNWWLFMRGRHFGFEVCAITQRPKLVAPTIRGNAGEFYVFAVAKSDAQELADDINADGLIIAPTLRQGEFLRAYWKDGKKVVDRHRIF